MSLCVPTGLKAREQYPCLAESSNYTRYLRWRRTRENPPTIPILAKPLTRAHCHRAVIGSSIYHHHYYHILSPSLRRTNIPYVHMWSVARDFTLPALSIRMGGEARWGREGGYDGGIVELRCTPVVIVHIRREAPSLLCMMTFLLSSWWSVIGRRMEGEATTRWHQTLAQKSGPHKGKRGE